MLVYLWCVYVCCVDEVMHTYKPSKHISHNSSNTNHAQALIAEQIQQKAIDENLEQAMEYSPEAFAHVFMLYVCICGWRVVRITVCLFRECACVCLHL